MSIGDPFGLVEYYRVYRGDAIIHGFTLNIIHSAFDTEKYQSQSQSVILQLA